jgi:hypothetical protein
MTGIVARCATRIGPLLAVLALLGGCASQQGLNISAKDAVLVDGADVPMDLAIGVYVPDDYLDLRFFASSFGVWVTPGDALRAAIETAAGAYFTNHGFIEADKSSDRRFNLVTTLAPDWGFVAGKIQLTLGYRTYNAAGEMVAAGEVMRERPIGNVQDSSGFYNAALKTMQIVLVENINTIVSGSLPVDELVAAADVDRGLLVNMEEPVSTGTAFFVSDTGQLLTAAHVTDGCLAVQVNFEGEAHDVSILGQSKLLDVALLQSEVQTDKFLALRAEPAIVLGERISTAGFPLQNVLASSANLTTGNVSSMQALPGSIGKFQFSAPVQPGSSGGPIVSETGELIGMTTGSLNVAAMAEAGIIPQNVNFALEGRYLARFGERHGSAMRFFSDELAKGDMAAVNAHVAASVAQIACYQ